MSITVGDILRVVASFVWDDGEINQNVFNAVIGGSGGPFTDDDIVDDAEDWLQQMYIEVISDMAPEISGSACYVYVYDSVDDDWDEVGTIGFSFTPTGATDELPRGVAALVNAYTSDPDVQGKKYLPAFIEGAVQNGLFSASVLVHMVDLLGVWSAPFSGAVSGASWIPAIWSPTETNAFAMSESGAASAIPAYQRRRKNNVGI